MAEDNFRKMIGRLIRYLANTLLLISIFVFVSGLFTKGAALYSDQLLWTQINSMWAVVVMLMLVENFYLKPEYRMSYQLEEKAVSRKKSAFSK